MLPDVKRTLIYQDNDGSGDISKGDTFKIITQEQHCTLDEELDQVTCANPLYESTTSTYFVDSSKPETIDEVLKQDYDAVRIVSPRFRLCFKDGKCWNVASRGRIRDTDSEAYMINGKFVMIRLTDSVVAGFDKKHKVEIRFLEGLAYMYDQYTMTPQDKFLKSPTRTYQGDSLKILLNL